MIAVLLCAGFATRLYPLTLDFPKPLLEVGGRPILEDLVAQLAASGRVQRFLVVSNARFYGKFLHWAERATERIPGLQLEVLDDGAWDLRRRLGAVGDLELAVARAELDGGVLVAGGDNLFRFPLDEFLEDYERRPRNLILVHRESDRERLRRTGVAELGPEGRVLRLWEKPEDPPSPWACPPLYLFAAGALARLRDFVVEAHDKDSPGHFVAWLAEREPVFAHEMDGERYDIGNPEAYRGAEAWLRARDSGEADPEAPA